ncbi:MAG TPA: hypothetical protein VFD92_00485 [Candidatus Binatia bacterium]|nr:hypothetical protein [Candidatus Binatia bacterium]
MRVRSRTELCSRRGTRGSHLVGLVVLLALLAWNGPARANPFAADKQTHFAAGVGCGIAATLIADQFTHDHRFIVGTFLGTIPGLAVEIHDSTVSSGFSEGDLALDFAGSALGAILTDLVVLPVAVRFFADDHGPDTEYGVEVGGTF